MNTPPGGAAHRSDSADITMTVSSSYGNVITGKLDRQASKAPEFVRTGTLVNFAEFLTCAAGATMFGAESFGTPLQSNVTIFSATRAKVLTAKCLTTRICSGDIISETEIRDAEFERVAVVTQTITSGGSPERPAKQSHGSADTNDPDEGMSAAAAHRRIEPPVADAEDIPATRRYQIFEGAKRVITRKGFERATIREIAEESGMRIPTMYQYFKNKDEILALIFDTYLARMEKNLRDAIHAKHTATEKLVAAISATLASINLYRREMLVMMQDTKSLRPEMRTSVVNKMLRYLGIFTTIIKDGVDSGEFRDVDPELYGNLIPMMCQVWAQRYWSVGKFGISELEKAILDITLRGVSKDPSVPCKPQR